MALPDRGIAPIDVPLRRLSPGHYYSPGFQVPLDGRVARHREAAALGVRAADAPRHHRRRLSAVAPACRSTRKRTRSSPSSRCSRTSRSSRCVLVGIVALLGGRSFGRTVVAALGPRAPTLASRRRRRRDRGQPLLLRDRRLHPVRALLVPAHLHVPARSRCSPSGVVRRDRVRASGTPRPFVVVGAPVSLYHWLVERVPSLEEGSSCSVFVPCAVPYFEELGYITLAFMALSAFLLVGRAARRHPRPRPHHREAGTHMKARPCIDDPPAAAAVLVALALALVARGRLRTGPGARRRAQPTRARHRRAAARRPTTSGTANDDAIGEIAPTLEGLSLDRQEGHVRQRRHAAHRPVPLALVPALPGRGARDREAGEAGQARRRRGRHRRHQHDARACRTGRRRSG